MIVLDANVVAKSYLNEPGTAEATGLLTGPHKLLAPELIRVEVAGAICRRVRLGELAPEEARVRCDLWFTHLAGDTLCLTPNQDILPLATELAIELKHSVQDCLYLALAKRYGVPLVTADAVFHKRAASAYADFIRLFTPRHN